MPPHDPAIDLYRHRLDHLRAEGQTLQASIASSPDSRATLAAVSVWQRECAATISQLSGGRKAHWLSRAFSDALLVPFAEGESASVSIIIARILDVIDRAGSSLAGAQPQQEGEAEPSRPRFPFIGDETLRSGLERAYLDGGAAAARGEQPLALITFCSILETVITDALERRGLDELAGHEAPPGPIVDWPFASRIAIAERARLISAGCARLPHVAREYRALLDARGNIAADVPVSARDVKLARDVLHVILRDLAPGR